MVLDKKILEGVKSSVSSETLNEARKMALSVFDEMRKDFKLKSPRKSSSSR